MTNKPMLSVERELLERVVDNRYREKENISIARHEALWELRALLDKPVDDPNLGIEMMRGAGSGILIQDHGAGWEAVTFNRGVRVSSFPIKGGYKESVSALQAAQHQGEPVAICRLWNEGGSGERTSVEFIKEPCADGTLLYAEQPAPIGLSVWFGSMPESNGKSNWTAILHRKADSEFPLRALSGGITIDRSEYHDRVRYEADRMRYLIGELTEEPDILAYDEKMHSGYVKPAPVAVVMPERMHIPAANCPERINAQGWNACLDAYARLNGVKP